MSAEPACFEITGTQTFSAAVRKARCTHRGMRRYSGSDFFLPASRRRRTDTGIVKGWFWSFLRVLKMGTPGNCGLKWWWQTQAGC